MAENDSEILNAVYKEVSEKLGMDAAMEIYQMFKGQQINFPVRFFNPERIQQIIIKEYDGKEVKGLEFKQVIVIDRGMTSNEKYISYTRALAKLTVIHDMPSLSDPATKRIFEGEEGETA